MQMNSKTLAVASAAGFIFIFILDWIWHGMLLRETYMHTAALWRPEGEMAAYRPFAILGQMLFAITAAIFFIYGYEGRGNEEGVKYGFYLGTLLAGMDIMCFAYLPVPMSLLLSWIALDYLKALGLGILFVYVHRRFAA